MAWRERERHSLHSTLIKTFAGNTCAALLRLDHQLSRCCATTPQSCDIRIWPTEYAREANWGAAKGTG